jgi:hypothetical protein
MFAAACPTTISTASKFSLHLVYQQFAALSAAEHRHQLLSKKYLHAKTTFA